MVDSRGRQTGHDDDGRVCGFCYGRNGAAIRRDDPVLGGEASGQERGVEAEVTFHGGNRGGRPTTIASHQLIVPKLNVPVLVNLFFSQRDKQGRYGR